MSPSASTADRFSTFHPLDPLSPKEIILACDTARKHLAESEGVKAIKFVATYTKPPSKLDVLASQGIPLDVGEQPQPKPTKLDRVAEVHVIDLLTGYVHVLLVTLNAGPKPAITSSTTLTNGEQPCLTIEELCEAEDALRKDPRVLARLKKMDIQPEELFCDGWTIGYDERFPATRRIQQCMTYARFEEDSNLYAHPLDFYPVLDANTFEVLAIDVPARRDQDGNLLASTTAPPSTTDVEDQSVVLPPRERSEFLPDLLEKHHGIKERDDLKPLIISQPEGVSFKMDGNEIEWQKWKMHIGFHYREGLVLSTVTYDDDGTVRPLFYRLSLAEMAPEWPHPRKFAFDVGEYGLGVLANELMLGKCCKGAIHYLPGAFVNHAGQPTVINNAICIHEEDAGLLFKHSDYRPGGRAHSVRSRKLVISMICTVANYEYAIYWNFFQDGNVQLEVRLTGILNLALLAPGESTGGFGTEVAPQINAQYHQHLFSLRVDPMIDGIQNSVVQTDIVVSPHPTGSAENFAGNAFTTEKTIYETAKEASADVDSDRQRYWSFVNENHKHYASKQPVGYKVMAKEQPKLLAQPDSWVAKRAPFATKSIWTVPYKEEELYPAGKWVPQTRITPMDSVSYWAERDENVRNTDIVTYLTVGVTHIPRPEDYPVMPQETCMVLFKPVGFFARNPALDVPSGADPRSVNAFPRPQTNGGNNGASATTQEAPVSNGSCCTS
ncbi:hypothetical protein QFC22_005553 [Naganishia vaughanmartiniae]|uniref:Uncharacterized protein n=1 Tax=Naganishia vaughanmartiniae TaxID=1424756 RepID=A0ACC2WVV9_9TREE|nr:hypothetical protein QFC22_005553 [Naganishia vaughanmartiniae]